jgi:cation diffusion facilitator CzcD-associated flavoprotein CzcO
MPTPESKSYATTNAATEPNAAQVLIVGGGAAGLSTAGALKKLGLAPIVLEQDAAIGGTWARRYDRLHLHTVRQLRASPTCRYPGATPATWRATSSCATCKTTQGAWACTS